MSNITKEQQTAISLFTCWWAMHEAQAEVIEEPFKPDQVALSFMGSGASTMVMVEHLRAVCDVLNALATPVASAAPSGELPPLPNLDEEWIMQRGLTYTQGQIHEYGAACHALGRGAAVRDYIENGSAIAHQPPKEALTDEAVDKMISELYAETPRGEEFDFEKFARRIEAATAPNKQLVAALHELALLMSDVVRGEYEPDSFTLQPAVHALAEVGIEFPDDDYLLTKRASCAVVPVEPTAAMIKAMAESRAVDDEGEYPLMLDLLDFSGENKTDTALRAAYAAALAAAGVAPLPQAKEGA